MAILEQSRRKTEGSKGGRTTPLFLAALAIGLAAAPPAAAQGWELGLQVGSSELADAAGFVEDRTASAIRILGGYAFDRRWSIQGSLGQFGDFTGTDPVTRLDAEAEINGGTLSLRYEVPLGSGRFAPWLEAGVAFTDVAIQLAGSEIRRLNGESFLYGVGVDLDFAERWTARLAWTEHDVEDTSISALAVGIVRRF